MQSIKKQSQACLLACSVWLALLAGCATPTQPDVGAVVVAPQVKLPPPPVIVQTITPLPTGYFQRSLVDYFSSSPVKPTTSTTPTPAAGLTHF